MTVREHMSQHETAQSLPLISKSATVTAVDSMDRDRRDEIRRELRELGEEHGFSDSIPARGRIDWDRVFEAAVAGSPWIVGRIGALHDRYEREYPSLLRLAFETDEPFDFVAGQYVTIRYEDRARPYSIASSPTRDETELCVRRVPGGKLSHRLCEDLSVGDRITVRGPNGHLHLEDPSRRDLAFFATGTGVAPLKSMIDYAFETGWDEHAGANRAVWLFLGAAWKDDLPYDVAFRERAADHDNFHYVPCVTRESWLAEWDGEEDYIQDALLKYMDERSLDAAVFGRHMAQLLRQHPKADIDARIDPGSLEVYACGINAMVYSLETAIRRLGVPDRHIHSEGYG